jgi:hypothetical protein
MELGWERWVIYSEILRTIFYGDGMRGVEGELRGEDLYV